MCRMIAAHGNFSAKAVFDNAVLMSEGMTGVIGSPYATHRDGWGMVWRDPVSGMIRNYRDLRPLALCYHVFQHNIGWGTDFLAIHTRSASVRANIGLEFTHPVESTNDSGVTWNFMHNGYLARVYQKLGMAHSEFDTREYSRYIIPRLGSTLNRNIVLRKLEDLRSLETGAAPVSTGANAIIVNKERFYIINWTMPKSRDIPYYMLHAADQDDAFYIASESLPNLTLGRAWEPLPFQSFREYDLRPIQKLPIIPNHYSWPRAL